MIYEEYLLGILHTPHVSEKVSSLAERRNTIVFIVSKKAKKSEIKAAVQKNFNVKVKIVNTLIIKGKIKRHKQYTGRRKDWKKAYVTLENGQNLNFSNRTE